MKVLLLNILLVSFSATAQKEDLNKLNTKLIAVFNNNHGLHLDYTLTVKGKGEEADSMNMSFYKRSTDVFKMQMGNAQTLLRDKNKMLKVDHVNKLIAFEIDTTTATNDFAMLAQLMVLADSAQTITFLKEEDLLVYDLVFKPGSTYKHIQLKFSSKTKLPSSLYAEYYPGKEQPYQSLLVNYKLWDLNWKDKNNELNMDQFVEKVNTGYQPAAALKNYKLLDPDKVR
jgi:hypothetical protein